ncbi:Adenine-specific DNA methylase, contains a Zn-ribbon domain [Desulforamulus putei DSM 12395]|uniref:Adenine-specific DNA methylase, contains a Zn-ribbon domain n=1 Tax=Desulforamulus putei DSM 12395 TaxID=1121429 RepID=A0A1M4SFZ1_9FIRM|nr:DUF1156 domain-containing protein [Desulforamulus putei]SHE31120.1 Adenine-specific DNA methylase, contains a Zn-ribbon domain [Desulforamulus putei DSM 12395]
MTKEKRPAVLIEKWFPVQELGIECQRENSSGNHPPPNRLHVWWARRPLVVSSAAILGSILGCNTNPDWFKKFIGILGDPIAAQKKIEEAKQTNTRVSNPFGYDRAFKYVPTDEQLEEFKAKLIEMWGEIPVVLDPMAGGGSIPLEAVKYGLPTYANDLNPVAFVIEKATFEYPAKYKDSLADDIVRWSNEIYQRAKKELEPYFPSQEGEQVFCYIWARTVVCPECGLQVPLSPNWWLQKKDNSKIAVKIHYTTQSNQCTFELVENVKMNEYDPDEGTVARGVGKCPRCMGTIHGDYIKEMAQTGRMGQQLYALGVQRLVGRRTKKSFRIPNEADLAAVNNASKIVENKLPDWQINNLFADELIPDGEKTKEPRRYGYDAWNKLFSPRQKLSNLTLLKHFNDIKQEILDKEEPERAKAIITYLAFILDKCFDYNSYLVRWDGTRNKIANTFDRHDFSFKWSFGEMNLISPGLGFQWATETVLDAYKGLAEIIHPTETPLFKQAKRLNTEQIHITQGSAANLHHIPDNTIHAIVVDPPYYDNVMYAELSDFFYVWMKRTLGDIYPEAFSDELTNKDDEAVANPARFRGFDVSPAELARQDYQQKMQLCFQEMYRVLRPDGVLTIMFTHKKVDAWDTLATALISAGFEITASWPVHTESEHSLHQARKNAAASTILLVCRKRETDGSGGWWEDILPEVRRTALQKVQEFMAADITGVDLYLATFGPVLGVLSRHWPVQDRSGEAISPDKALDEARRVVTDYRVQSLLQGRRGRFDPVTRWYILAWDIYQAPQFPFDEGHKLALSVGVDIDALRTQKQIYKKDGNFIVLTSPRERSRRGQVDVNAQSFTSYIDAIHTALLIYEEDGAAAVRRFVQQANLLQSDDFLSAYAALVRAIPAGQPEHLQLKDMALAAMDEKLDQLSLW